MAKKIILESELIIKINLSLAEQWEHENSYCRVEELRESNSSEYNWEVVVFSTGGETLDNSKECSELHANLIPTFIEKYDVNWNK